MIDLKTERLNKEEKLHFWKSYIPNLSFFLELKGHWWEKVFTGELS
jgi:hypothetical protein